jgi:4-diphosphocytidyl-2-C-methyl-D-erythritol kinase
MSGDVRRLKGVLYNGLEQASIDLYPAIGRLKDAFVKAGGSIVLMSGSGPSVFSVCRNRDEALRLKRALSAFSSQWRIFIVHTA